MFSTCIPFPSSGDKENIPVTRSEKRARRNALVDGQSASHSTTTLRAWLMSQPYATGTKTSKRPLVQRVISLGPSITILTNPARTQAQSVLPTIHEEVTRSPLSPLYLPPSPSPKSISLNAAGERAPVSASVQSVHRSSPSPLRVTILSNPEKEKRKVYPLGPKSILINPARPRSPSVNQPRSRPHVTILSDPEREKREAHPLTHPSVRHSRSPPQITILSNPEKEKRESHPRSTQGTKNIRNALAAALTLKRAPTVTITPVSIMEAPIPPPQAPAPAPAPAADPNADPVEEIENVKFVLSDIVIQITGHGVRDPETGRGAATALTSSAGTLGVPLVDWRGRLDEDELARYYPKEHSKDQFVHKIRSVVRSGSRSAAARRRDHARRRRQSATAASATTTPSPIALIVSHTRP